MVCCGPNVVFLRSVIPPFISYCPSSSCYGKREISLLGSIRDRELKPFMRNSKRRRVIACFTISRFLVRQDTVGAVHFFDVSFT